MKFVYLDKKDRIAAWFTLRHSLATAAVLIIFMGLPLWHESVSGRFLLEPAHSAVLRARVPGVVTQLDVKEGQRVPAGTVVARLENLPVRSDVERAETNLSLASEQERLASLHYADYGSALKEREQLVHRVEQLSQMNSALALTSPIEGTIMTARLEDMVGTYMSQGQELLEVADLSSLRARIYVSEYDLYKVHPEAEARLRVRGMVRSWSAEIAYVTARPTEIDFQLLGKVELQGMNPPHFYVVDLTVKNPDSVLKPGMTGTARVYGARRSILGLGWEMLSNFFRRKVW